MSNSNCCFLTCIQISQEVGQVVWYSHLFKNCPQFVVIHTVKDLGRVNGAEVDVFSGILLLFLWSGGCWQFDLWFLCLLKSSLNIWKFTVHVLLKPSLENYLEPYFASVWNACNCGSLSILWHCRFWGDWNENTFSSPVATVEISKFAGILSATLSQHHLLGFEIAQLEFHHLRGTS